MSSKEGYRKIAHFFYHNSVKYENDEFLFTFTVTEDEIRKLDELTEIGLQVDRYEGDQSYERCDLDALLGKKLTAFLPKQSLSDSGFNVYIDWDEYLSYRKNKLEPQSEFLILEDGNLYPYDKDRASRLKNYIKIAKFIRFLDELSELDSVYSSGHKPKVSFVQKVRIDVFIDYGSKDLDNDLDGFESLERVFASEEHKTQRNSLMRETLYSFLYSQRIDYRFVYLVERMSEFSSEFMENYNLFVSEFSLEKVRKEYEESKRNYISKINEVVSGIHTRMLGVPAVLVLAAFRFSDKAVSGQVVGNFIIFSAVAVYGLMMHYLIKSQRDTLTAIKDEASEHIKRFNNDYYPGEIKEISKISSDIQDKCQKEIEHLKIFYWMIGVLALVMIMLLGYSLGLGDFIWSSYDAVPDRTIWQLPFSEYT